jgi:hypothetical protein
MERPNMNETHTAAHAFKDSPLIRRERRMAVATLLLGLATLCFVLFASRDSFRPVVALYQGPKVVSARELQQAARSESSFKKLYQDSAFRTLEIAPLPVVAGRFTVRRTDGRQRYARFVVIGKTLLPATTLAKDAPLPTQGVLRPASPTLLKKARAQLSQYGPKTKIAPFVFRTGERSSGRLAAALLLFVPLLLVLFSLISFWFAARMASRALRGVSRWTPEQVSLFDRASALGGDGRTVTGNGVIAQNGSKRYCAAEVPEIIWAYALGSYPNRELYVHVESGEAPRFVLDDAAQEANIIHNISDQNPLALVGFNPTMDRLWNTNRVALGEVFRELRQFGPGERSSADVMAETSRRPNPPPTAPVSRPDNERRPFSGRKILGLSALGSLILSVLAVLPSHAVHPIKRAPIFPATWTARDRPLAAFVEKARGRSFRHPVRIDLLSESAYDSMSGNRAEREITTCAYDARCQEKGKNIDVRRSMFELMGLRSGRDAGGTSESGAYYSDVENRIFVRGTKLTPFLRSVIVHELTHAWQDQYFDLGSTFDRVKSNDQFVAFRSLVEGDATHVEEMYWQTLKRKRPDSPANKWRPSSFEYVEEVGFEFPYAYGSSYVKALRQKGGLSALDRRFTRLPTTIHEVLNGKRLAAVNWPDDAHSENESTLYEESLDALAYYVLLADQQPVDFDSLVANWNGGRIQLVSYQGSRCARIILGKPRNDGEQQFPQLVNDPTKGLPDVSTDETDSVSNCAPIGASAKLRTGDLRAVDRVMRRGFAMVATSVNLKTTLDADRATADDELAKADQRKAP